MPPLAAMVADFRARNGAVAVEPAEQAVELGGCDPAAALAEPAGRGTRSMRRCHGGDLTLHTASGGGLPATLSLPEMVS